MSSSSHRPSNPHRERDRRPPPLTAAQQDRQARNKDPYAESDDSDSEWGGVDDRFDAYGNASYANIQLRRDAAIKLDNPELVMMLAMARNDSIPATRHYLMKILCGYITQEDIDAEEAARERDKEMEKEREEREKARLKKKKAASAAKD